MEHIYNNTFFDYIDDSASASAEAFVDTLNPLLNPRSVLDLGSGRGVWLARWRAAGACDVLGVDGDYVDRQNLAIPEHCFRAADLTQPVATDHRFDLAQSLEVGEHLPERASRTLVDSLTNASDLVLFSAAVPGQGGECHINEQPLAYWQALFAERGYQAYDCVRPEMADKPQVAPWYRYNAVLYANAEGRKRLPARVVQTMVSEGTELAESGNVKWRLRRAIVGRLPRNTVTRIAQLRASVLAWQARTRHARRAAHS